MKHVEFSIGERSISLLRHLYTVLQQQDASYPKEQQFYLDCQKALRMEAPDVTTFIDALETRLSAELTYVSWLGFVMNLECFQFPVHKKMLELDYEELHQESQFGRFPQVEQANRTIEAFLTTLPESSQEAADGILDFFSYLETTGFKLAHYWGFQFGNQFLPNVIPGYVPDTFFTTRYRRMIGEDLGFEVV